MKVERFVEQPESHTAGGRGFLLEDGDGQIAILLTVSPDIEADGWRWSVESLSPYRAPWLDGIKPSEDEAIRWGKSQATLVVSDLMRELAAAERASRSSERNVRRSDGGKVAGRTPPPLRGRRKGER